MKNNVKHLICINCPRGCNLTIDLKTYEVSGNFCPRGAVYGKNEILNPQRVITSTVRIDGSNLPMCPVKTEHPIPKSLMFDALNEINSTLLKAPIQLGDIIIYNIAGSGVNLVSTRDMPKI